MKMHINKKAIGSALALTLLLGSLTACGSAAKPAPALPPMTQGQPAANSNGTQPQAPQPAESIPPQVELTLEEEIRLTYLSTFCPNEDISVEELDVRFVYQTKDSAVVYVDGPWGFDDVVREEKVGGLTFTFPSSQRMFVYSEGNFLSLKQAFDQSKLSLEELQGVYLMSNGEEATPLDMTDGIVKAFLKSYTSGGNLAAKDLSLRYVARFENAAAVFINGPFQYTQAFRTVMIGNMRFEFPNGQKMYIYHDGQLYTLKEAYNAELLTQEQWMEIYSSHSGEKGEVS